MKIETVGQKVDRASGIGGSDMGAIAGLSKWRTPFDVYLEKTGKAPAEREREPLGRDPLYWGKHLERPIMAAYEKREKLSLVYLFDEPVRHPERSWQIGSPDAIAPSLKLGVDAKNVGHSGAAGFGEQGSDDLPDEYLAQGSHYLSLMDYERWDFAVLVAGQEFRTFTMTRNRDLENGLLEIAFEFWTKHVLADIPPPITDSDTTRAFFRKRFGRELLDVRDAVSSETALVEEWAEVRAAAKALEKRKDNLEAAIKFAIGDAAGLKGSDFSLSWKADKDSVVTDWKSAFTELRTSFGLVAEQVIAISAKIGTPAPTEAEVKAALEEIVKRHTTTKPGKRPLRPTFSGRLLLSGGGEE
jgi:predicted phage-related endonuclease